MYIPERKSNGTVLVPIEAKAFEARTVYVQGAINEESSAEFVREIIELNRQNDTEPIKVLITSGGGSVVHGLAEYELLFTVFSRKIAPQENGRYYRRQM